MGQGSAYDQLHRNIVIRSDIYGGINSKPRILAASSGFRGIIGIPGLSGSNGIALASAAGAGIVAELVNRDPPAPLRNITSGSPVTGVQLGGFSNSAATETLMDAMPIEFSHPVLPSTVLPKNFRIRLNTGEVVTPLYVAQNPNYDLNERQTVVAYGYFGNRLPSSNPSSRYPVLFEVVGSDTPLQLITPRGLVNGSGLSHSSNNPYDPYNGPTLVGAKLSRLSLAGDYPSPAFANSIGNHGVEYYGTGANLYRLRLFTSAGFSPNGVSGFKPQEFSRFFQLKAQAPGRNRRTVTISQADQAIAVKGGTLKVRGIADLGQGLSANPSYTYSEDHDNQFDIIIEASSADAVRALQSVVLPDPRTGTHSPIYNPGGPGTAPRPAVNYTQPSGGQTLAIEQALEDPATVSFAAQSLSAYDSADDLAVAFRLRDRITGEWRLTSSSANANSLVASGNWRLVDVPFATNANDSYTADVIALHNSSRNDTAYSANPSQIQQLEKAGYTNQGAVFKAYNSPLHGLDPIWQMSSRQGQHLLASSPKERQYWQNEGWRTDGIAFYSVNFPNSTAAAGWQSM
jgi:hypothetical protein